MVYKVIIRKEKDEEIYIMVVKIVHPSLSSFSARVLGSILNSTYCLCGVFVLMFSPSPRGLPAGSLVCSHLPTTLQ